MSVLCSGSWPTISPRFVRSVIIRVGLLALKETVKDSDTDSDNRAGLLEGEKHILIFHSVAQFDYAVLKWLHDEFDVHQY